MKTDNIVIVGGGSAGWMTAAMLIKTFPEKNIILIESPTIEKIGVGESTYQGINGYLEYLEIDREDFFASTDATIKLAVQFRNFYKESGEPDFIFPFGYPELQGNMWGLEDWQVRKYLDNTIAVSDYAESYFPAAHLIKHNRMSDNEYGQFDSFDPIFSTALQFDATKFAHWLRDSYAKPRGVQHIVSHVSDVVTNEGGIDYLVLDNGSKIIADLFVDCTGFNSILLGKSLGEPFISYSDVLPNTNAWATQIPYINPEKEINLVTRCTALKNGWCWNTPLWSRLGSGYVYSSNYTSHDDALKEFKEYIKKDLDIPRDDDAVESLEFRNISMRVGIHERVWVKNVVAIGLSAGFIEPLEGNGLFTIHEFLFSLVKSLQRELVSQWDRDIFNYAVRTTFDEFVEFIKIHYSLSIRNDSEYWMANFNRSYDINESRIKDKKSSHIYVMQDIKFNTFSITHQGATWISAGMNYMLLDPISIRLGEISKKTTYSKDLEDSFMIMDMKKNRWKQEALSSKTTYQYLKDKYYNYLDLK